MATLGRMLSGTGSVLRFSLFTPVALAAFLLFGGTSRAGDGDVPAENEKYVGVSPDLPRKNPLPPPKGTGPQLIWTGFRKADEGALVFLQTSTATPFEMGASSGKRISVFLRNCRIHLDNNSRRLETRFFGTNVLSVQARQRKKDVEIIVTMKAPSVPTSRTEAGPDGSQNVVLVFPADVPTETTDTKSKDSAQ
jgi:hypothetical protein